jgi:phage shock protein C
MSIADEIEKLQALRDRGSLSEAEFARAKARILGEPSAVGSGDSADLLHQLRRSKSDRIVGGVCGGLGKYTGMPSWAWRVLFCLTFFGFGFGLLLYVLLWLFVPEES